MKILFGNRNKVPGANTTRCLFFISMLHVITRKLFQVFQTSRVSLTKIFLDPVSWILLDKCKAYPRTGRHWHYVCGNSKMQISVVVATRVQSNLTSLEAKKNRNNQNRRTKKFSNSESWITNSWRLLSKFFDWN